MTPDEELAAVRCRADLVSHEARQKLAGTIDWISDTLREIDRGASFCEDRGFGWGFTQERDVGSGAVFDRLREWPILRRLLPSLRHLRHQTEPVIAMQSTASDDARIACDVLYGNTEFTTNFGKDWEETILTVRLGSDAIVVAERSVADDTYGRPFMSSEDRLNYPNFTYTHPIWTRLCELFPEEKFRRLRAHAEKRWKVSVLCDQCGDWVHRYELPGDGSELHHRSCWGDDTLTPIDAATRAALRDAMPVQDLPAIAALNATWARGYCVVCDVAYCIKHWKRQGCPNEH